jgi:hypothetical protein
MKASPTEKVMITEMYHSNKRMETAIFGDKEAGIEGIVGIVTEHKKYIELYKSDIPKIQNSEKIADQYKTDRVKAVTFFTVLIGLWELFKENIKDIFHG